VRVIEGESDRVRVTESYRVRVTEGESDRG
jgi:hypothetical protein